MRMYSVCAPWLGILEKSQQETETKFCWGWRGRPCMTTDLASYITGCMMAKYARINFVCSHACSRANVYFDVLLACAPTRLTGCVDLIFMVVSKTG
jgi:hypothetical protein